MVMKKISLFLITFLIYFNGVCQSVNPPSNVILTTNSVVGNAEIDKTVEIDLNDDGTFEHSIVVNYQGIFRFTFPSPITLVVAGSTQPPVNLRCVDSQGNTSAVIEIIPTSESAVIDDLANGRLSIPRYTTEESNRNAIFQNQKRLLANSTIKYKATIWNTNFSVPVARFNFTKDEEGSDTKDGELVLFNSIGAGFGISMGEIKRTRDNNGDIIDEDFTNTFGAHLGVLFSAGSGEDSQNIFAPNLTLTILDFGIGIGYELGSIKENQEKVFLTISYAIPLYKLTKGKFWIWKSDEGDSIDDSDTKSSRQGGI
jgi:hypothetical protein